MKKLLSILLAVLMVATLGVVNITAEDDEPLPQEENYVAQVVNGNKYASLTEAVHNAPDGAVIELLSDCSGNGVGLYVSPGSGQTGTKNITIDFKGFKYTIDGDLQGSTGTVSQAFHLEKGVSVTLKNGTMYSEKAAMLVQNYCNLTLDNMVLDGSKITSDYTMSNNNGNVVINNTKIIAPVNGSSGSIAFDVCRFASYDGPSVLVKGNSVIEGNVEISSSAPKENATHSLTIEGGTFNGTLKFDGTSPQFVATITGGNYKDDSFKDYVASEYGLYKNASETYDVLPKATSIIFTADEMNLLAGASTKLNPVIVDASDESYGYNLSVAFASSNEAVVKVDENGVVMAVAPGTAVITASSEGLESAEITITVPELISDVFVSVNRDVNFDENNQMYDILYLNAYNNDNWEPMPEFFNDLFKSGVMRFVNEKGEVVATLDLSKDNSIFTKMEYEGEFRGYELNLSKTGLKLSGDLYVETSVNGYTTQKTGYTMNFDAPFNMNFEMYINGSRNTKYSYSRPIFKGDNAWMFEIKDGYVVYGDEKLKFNKYEFVSDSEIAVNTSNDSDGSVYYNFVVPSNDVTLKLYVEAESISQTTGGVSEETEKEVIDSATDVNTKLVIIDENGPREATESEKAALNSLRLSTVQLSDEEVEDVIESNNSLKDKVNSVVGANEKIAGTKLIDVTLWLSDDAGTIDAMLYETAKKVEFTVLLDDDTTKMIKEANSVAVVRVHEKLDGSVDYEVLPASDYSISADGRTVSIKSDKFSTFAIVAIEKVASNSSYVPPKKTAKPVVNTSVR